LTIDAVDSLAAPVEPAAGGQPRPGGHRADLLARLRPANPDDDTCVLGLRQQPPRAGPPASGAPTARTPTA
jgi:hypothetical protein